MRLARASSLAAALGVIAAAGAARGVLILGVKHPRGGAERQGAEEEFVLHGLCLVDVGGCDSFSGRTGVVVHEQ